MPPDRRTQSKLCVVGRARNRKRERRRSSQSVRAEPQARRVRVGPAVVRVGADGVVDESTLPVEVQNMIHTMRRPDYLAEDGRLIGRPFVSALFNGWRYVAVGSRMAKLPPEATFHEFLEAFLVDDVLGRDWVAGELARGSDARPIARWLADLRAMRARTPGPSGVRQVDMTGSALAFLTLAYDVYSTYHCAELPERILRRLRHPVEFQGAKYEIAVAGLFARAGFTIEWIDDRTRKRPEFVASHKTTGERLVVEAKSRHRPGVLGRPGAIDVEAMKADLDRLFHDALEKETDGLPYAIYLDANMPVAATGDEELRRLREIQRMFDRHATGAKGPDPFVGVTVTNFSWHYAGDAPTIGRSESVLVVPRYPLVALHDPRTLQLIFEAAKQYGDVPGLFPNS